MFEYIFSFYFEAIHEILSVYGLSGIEHQQSITLISFVIKVIFIFGFGFGLLFSLLFSVCYEFLNKK